MQGRIVKLISNDYTVLANNKLYVCKSRGKFRNMNISPLVGDLVLFDFENNYIMEVKPRKNSLVRPPICNVDQAVIITSVKQPDFSTNLLDKLLVIIEFNNIKPIICITKMDLLEENEIDSITEQIDYYRKIGYEVYFNTEIEKIKNLFKDKITVFTGQSGAGKSTLLNSLDENLNIKTNDISLALGRGKHTTRHVELIPLFDGLVADTPGFSAISFHDMTNSDIRDNFIEFNQYRHHCKYKDCMHQNEDDCKIKNMVDDNTILKTRYENYLKFITKR
jgi:ribosome biogenesis GTPase